MFGFYDKYFKFFGLDIAYYGLIIAIGMGIGVFLACKNAKLRGLKTDDLVIVACYVLPLSIIGARIYYVLFSLDSFHSFWQVFEIWKGGMAIYGGVIGGAIGVMLYCLIHKKNFLDVADVVIPSLILGQAIGRWGNFINQEAYGYYIDNPNAQWFPIGVYIDNCRQADCNCGGAGGWHMATFFYESLWNIIAFVIIMVLLRKKKVHYRGSITALYFIIYGAGRIWIEALRTDSLYIGAIRVSQLLSIFLVIGGAIFLITSYFLHKKGKIKSLQELEPYYAFALQPKEGEKVKEKKSWFKKKEKLEEQHDETEKPQEVLKHDQSPHAEETISQDNSTQIEEKEKDKENKKQE